MLNHCDDSELCCTSVLEMKPHNRVKGRLPFPAHADHILKRIKAATRELEAIQAEIYGRMGEGRIKNAKLGEDPAAARLLGEFKAALDQLRTMLWLCTEHASENAEDAPDRDRRLARATELLRALAPQSESGTQSTTREPGSFFDRLDRVIDNYMAGGGTLIEPSPRRRKT
jgi:hypothetical protein